jgi:hypothetical protein
MLRHLAVVAGIFMTTLLLDAQDRGFWGDEDNSEKQPYTAKFTFSRIRYRSPWGYGGGAWAHDYPRADEHIPRLLDYLTTVDANLDGTNVFDLSDNDIFLHPLIYLSEPGYWALTENEASNLRRYLLKGGFIIFDDFEREQWHNFAAQMRRVLPDHAPVQIDVTHPIFHSFFEMKSIDFPHPLVNVRPSYYGFFENNDPTGRMLGIVNYDNDLAEYWEWSDMGYFPVDFTNEAYKLGINYVVYSMTH